MLTPEQRRRKILTPEQRQTRKSWMIKGIIVILKDFFDSLLRVATLIIIIVLALKIAKDLGILKC